MKKHKHKRLNDNRIFFEKITSVFLLMLVTVFLLFTGTGGYESIMSFKYVAFCVICGGYILTIVVFGVEGRLVGELKLNSPIAWLKNTSWVQRMMLIYLAISWVSTLASQYFPTTIIGASRYEGALTISIYVLMFILVSQYGKVSEKLLWALAIATAIFASISLIQLMGYNPLGLFPEGYNYFDAFKAYSGQYLGTIGNVDLVAAFLCIVFPVMVGCIIRFRNKKALVMLIPLILSLIVLIKMSVMAAFAGVGLGLLVSLPLLFNVEKMWRKRIAIGAGVVLALGFLVVLFFDISNGMLHEIHQLLHGNADGSFGSGRLYIWSCVTEAIPSNLILGTGPDTMSFADFEPFTRYDDNLGGTIVSLIDIAHNDFLNIIYHQGILAFGAYAAGLVLAAIKWIKCGSTDAVAAITGSAVLCYCIQAFFGFSVCITAPFFWATLGLLERRTETKLRGESDNEKKTVLS